MSNESPTPEFWERADAIIGLANEQCKDAQNSKVSTSLIYASARFCSFIVANNSERMTEIKSNKNDAVNYFTEQFHSTLWPEGFVSTGLKQMPSVNGYG